MLAALRIVHFLSLALWLGESVFFSLVVAPTLFSTFPTERAGEIMSALFPNYYRFGYLCGVLLLATSVMLWRSSDGGFRWAIVGGVAALMLVCSLYAGMILQPRAHVLRAELHGATASAAARSEFDRIHKRAVQLNGAVLLGNLLLASVVAGRLRP